MNSAFNQNANGVSAAMASPVFISEPPLSPPSPRASAQPSAPQPSERPALEVAPAPEPAAPAAPPTSVAPAAAPATEPEPDVPAGLPLEGLLLRFGLITTEQLTEAMREKSATGKGIGAIVLERGWVDEAQLARVASYAPAFTPEPAAESEPTPAAAPAPVPAAEPEPKPEPVAADPEPPPAPAAQPTGQRVKVYVRLTSGDRVDAGTFAGLDQAKEHGAEIARALATEAPEWPFVAGRFLRPETIASVDVEPELLP